MPAAATDVPRSFDCAKPPVLPGGSPAKTASKDDLLTQKLPSPLRTSAAAGPTPSHGEQWQSLLKEVKEGGIIKAPACTKQSSNGSTLGSTEQALLVWLPGALVKPANYETVAEDIRQQMTQFAPNLEFWVAIPGIDLFKLGAFMTSLDQQPKTPTEQPATPTSATSLGALIAAESALPEDDMYAMPLHGKEAPDKLLRIAIQQVVSNTSFKPRMIDAEPGRHLNVAVAMHSAAAVAFTDAASRSAGALLFVQTSPTATFMASTYKSSAWATSSLPICILLGQLDGAMMFSNMLSEAVTSAWVAQSEGAVEAATRKPCIWVPGLNHAQMCGMPNMYHRGDCAATASLEETKAAAAKAAAAFLAVHFASKGSCKPITEQQPQAVEYLLQQTKATAAWLKPFAAANGIADLEAAWAAGQALDAGNDQLAIQLSASSTLARPMVFAPNAGVTSPLIVPGPGGPAAMSSQLKEYESLTYNLPVVLPGQISMAEKEVANMQEAIVRNMITAGLLPASVMDTLRVRVSIQPTVPAFEQSHCSVSLTQGGAIVVRAHAFMHWPMLDKRPVPMMPAALHCASHCLWVKLKGAAVLAMEISQLLGLPASAAHQCQGLEVSASELNAAVMQRALNMVDQTTRTRYEEHGVPLEFASDNFTHDPHSWTANTRMTFKVSKTVDAAVSGCPDAPPAAAMRGGGQVVHVHSPACNLSVSSGAAAPLPEDVDALRAHGTLHAKVMSVAQAVEWIMLGAHRQVTLAPEQGCFWGGHGAPQQPPQ